jgi:NAD(P)H-hydrate repair Nnr-like enzyme with NAD(P)H-hydrate dehydratase domain
VTTLTGIIAAVIAREPHALRRFFAGTWIGAQRGRHDEADE